MTRNRDVGKSATEMNEEYQERMNAVSTTTYCTYQECSWTFDGTAKDGREKVREHWKECHPELLTMKRTRRPARPARMNNRLTAEEKKEVERDRQRRARLHGIDVGIWSSVSPDGDRIG